MGVGKTFLQPHRLDRQNLLTAFRPLCFCPRHERTGVKLPGKPGLCHLYLKGYTEQPPLSRRLEGGILPPLTQQALHINFGINNAILKPLAGSKDGSIFRNYIVSAKYQICGGFTFSRICIDISGN